MGGSVRLDFTCCSSSFHVSGDSMQGAGLFYTNPDDDVRVNNSLAKPGTTSQSFPS